MARTLGATPRLGGQAADATARPSLRASPRLPETAERVETRVSHRKQTIGHLSTRDGSRQSIRPISERTTKAGETPALPERAANAPRDHSLIVEAPGFSPAKEQRRQARPLSFTLRVAEGRRFTLTKKAPIGTKLPPSKLEPLISNFENLIGTPERLEAHVSRRKQTLGCTSNRYRSRVVFASNSDAALPARAIAL